jgi:hypothetical protein
MPLYDKPVRLLFRDMVQQLGLERDQVLQREQVFTWFHTHYPKVKDATISAFLLKMSTNAPSRIHYGVSQEGADDLLYQIDSQRFRLYDPANDPSPIYKAGVDVPGNGEDAEHPGPGSEFAYERDLQNFVAKNLALIEPGLRLYEEEEGITGIEFPVGGRRIDILALDAQNNYVVIELKVSRGYDRVVGQLLRYVAWIKRHQAEPGQGVRGVIIAREISEDIQLACSQLNDVALYEYQLSVSLRQVGLD